MGYKVPREAWRIIEIKIRRYPENKKLYEEAVEDLVHRTPENDGIPQHSLCDSAMRHLVKHMRGDQDEDHLRAAAWNIMWALDQTVTHPELNDLVWSREGGEKHETD